MMFFGLIFLVFGGLIVLVLVIGVIAYFSGRRPDFLKQRSNDAPSTKVEDSLLDILQERYARGEIDEEEYQKLIRNLKS
ncbi:MAG: SHOCT domain-containing protein [Brevefilum sp.]|nr:SHOCT domain-containing protein [Brevefilum sp.]MDT8380713.1 SHOCT domain-containing protein [Brevefilum sp.]MDW7755973.1 SHOCT domain-containing protein [Brevefilum sp.]